MKTIDIIINGRPTGHIIASDTTTVQQLANTVVDHLSSHEKNSANYTAIFQPDINFSDYQYNLSEVPLNTSFHISQLNNPQIKVDIKTGIGDLTPDLVGKLGMDMSYDDIISLCQTNRKFNKAICQNRYFWNNKILNDFGLNMTRYRRGATGEDYIKFSIVNDNPKQWINTPDSFYILYLTEGYWYTDAYLNFVPNLLKLNLEYNSWMKQDLKQNILSLQGVTDNGLNHVPNLTHLDLTHNNDITNKGLEPLEKLTHLNLTDNMMITNEGLKYLPNLTHLNLTGRTNITDEGLKHIPNLRMLRLDEQSRITDAGLKYLPKLEILYNFDAPAITKEGTKDIPYVNENPPIYRLSKNDVSI